MIGKSNPVSADHGDRLGGIIVLDNEFQWERDSNATKSNAVDE